MINQELENLRKLAQSWNNLDINHIAIVIDEGIVYESQWVLLPIEGKVQFLNYLKTKFDSIKKEMHKEIISLYAEIAMLPILENRHCIVLTQITKSEIRKVTILIKNIDNKINHIEVCFIPKPEEAILSGEIPK